MDITAQLNHAIAFVEENICEDLSLADIAGATCFSPYHFGRLFCYLTGTTLSEYVRKRKLSLAATDLRETGMKVIDAAVKYGYDSPDSFTRAFSAQHGLTPSEVRAGSGTLKIYPPLSFYFHVKGVQEMNWKIEKKEAFQVYGIETLLSADDLGKASDFWDETHADGSRGSLPEVHALVGHNNKTEGGIPYMIFAFLKDGRDPGSYKVVDVPANTWAIFRSEGMPNHDNDVCKIPELFGRAYSEWLPTSGYERAEGPDLEIYGDHYEEVWIPVRKAS